MGNKKYQVHSFVGSGLNITIDDLASPQLALYLNEKERVSLALRDSRHVAYMTQTDMKKELNAGQGGARLAGLTGRGVSGALKAAGKDYYYKHRGTNLKPFASRRHFSNSSRVLSKAIGYQQRADGSVVGWLSSSAQELGGAVQSARRGRNLKSGGDQAPQVITKKMQRYFAAVGFYGEKKRTIGKKPYLRKPRAGGNSSKSIDQVRRPYVGNYYAKNTDRMVKMFRDRFYLKLEEQLMRKFA